MSESESLVLSESKHGRMSYNRSSSDKNEVLKEQLRNAYQTDCVVATSGMAAISSIYNAIFLENNFENMTVVYSSELYCDTPRLFRYYSAHYQNISCQKIDDITDSKGIKDLFINKLKNKKVILHIESCSNPNGYIMDYSILKSIQRFCKEFYLVIDNTWLTHCIFNPFQNEHIEQIGDHVFVAVSLTKYYSGGQCIGGAVMSNNYQIMFRINDANKVMGHHVSPHNSELIANRMIEMDQRISSSAALTLQMAHYLKDHPKVFSVNYPLLPEHPSHQFAKSMFLKDGPSVLTFFITSSKTKFLKVVKSSQIDLLTSFGSELSRLDPWPLLVTLNNQSYLMVRLALGYNDDYDRVVSGLNDILDY